MWLIGREREKALFGIRGGLYGVADSPWMAQRAKAAHDINAMSAWPTKAVP